MIHSSEDSWFVVNAIEITFKGRVVMISIVALTRDQVRRVDEVAVQEYGMSGLVLMENAGRGCAERISEIIRLHTAGNGVPVTILCGKGNNGGDGYVIARHLELLGHPVSLVALASADELGGDARANAEVAKLAGLAIASLPSPDELQTQLFSAGVVVDCMLGTGAQGEPREPYVTAIRLANHAAAVRIAIDLPTGLDCDSGTIAKTTFRADHTLTMVAEKVGFSAGEALSVLGKVTVVPIGIPRKMLAALSENW